MPATQVPFWRRLGNRGTWKGVFELVESYVRFITTVSPRLFCLPFHSNTDSSQSATGVRPQCCLQSTRVKIDADRSQKSPRLSLLHEFEYQLFNDGLQRTGAIERSCQSEFPPTPHRSEACDQVCPYLETLKFNSANSSATSGIWQEVRWVGIFQAPLDDSTLWQRKDLASRFRPRSNAKLR